MEPRRDLNRHGAIIRVLIVCEARVRSGVQVVVADWDVLFVVISIVWY